MLTKDNYQVTLLDEYKELDKILIDPTKSLDEIIAALPPNVNVIMSQLHMITPLIIAIFHKREDLIYYLVEHKSTNLRFYHEDYNPFIFALDRSIADPHNKTYIATLLFLITNNVSLSGAHLSSRLQSPTSEALIGLIHLIRLYRNTNHVDVRIIQESRIAKYCEDNFAEYNAAAYWQALNDKNIINMLGSDVSQQISDSVKHNHDFYIVIRKCIDSMLANSKLGNVISNPLKLFNACMFLGRVYLDLPTLSQNAITYFAEAKRVADKYSLDLPDATKNFFLAFQFIAPTVNMAGEFIYSEPSDETKFKFILALENPAKAGSLEAMACLLDIAKPKPEWFNLNVLMASYIYIFYTPNKANIHPTIIAYVAKYQDLAEAHAFFKGITKPIDLNAAYFTFERVATEKLTKNPQLSLHACRAAISTLVKQISLIKLNVPAVMDLSVDSDPADIIEEDVVKHLKVVNSNSSGISTAIKNAMQIFGLMISVNTDSYSGADISAHFKSIFDFGKSTKKNTDRLLILKAAIEYYNSVMNYFEGTDNLDSDDVREDTLKEFFKNVRKNNLLEKVINWANYIPVLSKHILYTKNGHIRLVILSELKRLTRISRAEIKNDELQRLVMSTTVEAYYFNRINYLSVQQLHKAIEYYEEMENLIIKMRIKIDLSKYSAFYMLLCDKDPAAPEAFSLYEKAVRLGNKQAIFKALDLFDNSNVEYESKIKTLWTVLQSSLYPENADIIKLTHDKVKSLIKIKYPIPNTVLPENLQNLLNQTQLAMRCLNAWDMSLIRLINDNYFPALIKLTLSYIKANNQLYALYCCVRLVTELTFGQEQYQNEYGFTQDSIVSIKSRALEFVSLLVQNPKGKYQKLAIWITGFLAFISSLDKNKVRMICKHDTDFSRNVQAFILGNAENAEVEHVFNYISSGLKTFIKSSEHEEIKLIFFSLRSEWGDDNILYQSEVDSTVYVSKGINGEEKSIGTTARVPQIYKLKTVELDGYIVRYQSSDDLKTALATPDATVADAKASQSPVLYAQPSGADKFSIWLKPTTKQTFYEPVPGDEIRYDSDENNVNDDNNDHKFCIVIK